MLEAQDTDGRAETNSTFERVEQKELFERPKEGTGGFVAVLLRRVLEGERQAMRAAPGEEKPREQLLVVRRGATVLASVRASPVTGHADQGGHVPAAERTAQHHARSLVDLQAGLAEDLHGAEEDRPPLSVEYDRAEQRQHGVLREVLSLIPLDAESPRVAKRGRDVFGEHICTK